MKWLSGIPEEFAKQKEIVEKPASPPIPVEQIMKNALDKQDKTKSHMAFLGYPGSGKTTLVKYLAHSVASGKAEEWGLKGFIPFFIDLTDYHRRGDSDLLKYALDKAVEHIVDKTKRNGIKKVLERAITECEENSGKDGRVIFLLDALDETRDEKRRIVEEIERIRDLYKKAFIIVTSRTIGYYEAPLDGFECYLIEDLQIEEMSEFVRTWFRMLAEEKSGERDWDDWVKSRTDFLIGKIDDTPGLRRIVVSPLHLTFLVLLASDPDAELPQTRAALYSRYFEKLFFNWEKKHGPLPFSKDEVLEGFREICWIIHGSLFGNIKYDPTRDFIKKPLKDSFSQDPDQLLDFWSRTGIFFVAKTKDQTEFILPRHLSLLEYGFACKLAQLWDDPIKREELWKALKANVNNRYLYEPLMLFVGQIEDPSTFFKRALNLKATLFHSNLFFLGKALEESKNKVEKEVVEELHYRFLELYHSLKGSSLLIERYILECIGISGGTQSLVGLSNTTTDIGDQLELTRAIGQLGDTKLAISLLMQLHDAESDPERCHKIAEAIGFMGEKGLAISLLIQLHDAESDPKRRYEIARSIGKLGDKELALALLKQLHEAETDHWNRYIIARSIGELGDKEFALSLLKKLYNYVSDPKKRHENTGFYPTKFAIQAYLIITDQKLSHFQRPESTLPSTV